MSVIKKKCAVIGYGGMGGWHTRHLLESDAAKLAGIYDIDPKRAKAARDNNIFAYDSLEALLSDKKVDFVTIATPNDTHKPLAIKAMEAGKHVICEKPAALSSAELEDMCAAADRYSRVFSVHQNRRWDCDYLMMKEVYASGRLGEVFGVESRIQGSRGIPGDWRRKKEHGGGMLLDWGVHLIDQMLGIVSDRKVASLYCRFSHIANKEVDDGFKLDLYFENGLTARIEVGTENFISLPRFYMTGTKGSAIINDWREDCRTLCLGKCDDDGSEIKPVVTAAGLTKTMAPRDEKSLVEETVKRPFSDVHDYYRNFAKAIDGKEDLIVTHKQLMRVMRIMEAAMESDRISSPISFDDN